MKVYRKLSTIAAAMFSWWPPLIFLLAYDVSWWYALLFILWPVLVCAPVVWYEFWGPRWSKTPAAGPFRKDYQNYP